MKSRRTAAVSYLFWPGWIIAFLTQEENDDFARRHLNQAFCIRIISLMSIPIMFIPYIGSYCGLIIGITTLALTMIGLCSAARGSWKPFPVIGEMTIF